MAVVVGPGGGGGLGWLLHDPAKDACAQRACRCICLPTLVVVVVVFSYSVFLSPDIY